MRRNHYLITCFAILSAIFLAISIFLEWRIDTVLNISWPTLLAGHRAFGENVFIGLFVSSVLIVFVAVLDYFKERETILHRLSVCISQICMKSVGINYIIRLNEKGQPINWEEEIQELIDLLQMITVCLELIEKLSFFSKGKQLVYSSLKDTLKSLYHHTDYLLKAKKRVKYQESEENLYDIVALQKEWLNFFDNCEVEKSPIGLVEYLQDFKPVITVKATFGMEGLGQ